MVISQAWKELVSQYSPSTLEFFGTCAVQLVFFWGISIVYTSLPYLFPVFSNRHKLQKLEKQPTVSELKDCVKIVSRNQAVSTTAHLVLLTLDRFTGKAPSFRFDTTLPGPFEILRDIVAGIFIREVLFYYIHRLFHHPYFYPAIHKPHHRFTAPVAIAAQYTTVTEHLLANILPVTLPLMITKSHIVTFWAFLAVELAETTTVHSGYDFFAKLAKKHDSHHEKFMVNFGVVGLLDWAHGTADGAKSRKKD